VQCDRFLGKRMLPEDDPMRLKHIYFNDMGYILTNILVNKM
jgi:hypothetical protein